MGLRDEEIRANRDYFAAKLRAAKPRNDVLAAVERGRLDFVLLDVRPRESYAQGHIPGAWSAPLAELERIAALIPKGVDIVTYAWGQDCHLSCKAALQLSERGYLVREMTVGWKEWTANRHPTHRGTPVGARCTCSRTTELRDAGTARDHV
jgi:ArsR family transcriptional regulator